MPLANAIGWARSASLVLRSSYEAWALLRASHSVNLSCRCHPAQQELDANKCVSCFSIPVFANRSQSCEGCAKPCQTKSCHVGASWRTRNKALPRRVAPVPCSTLLPQAAMKKCDKSSGVEIKDGWRMWIHWMNVDVLHVDMITEHCLLKMRFSSHWIPNLVCFCCSRGSSTLTASTFSLLAKHAWWRQEHPENFWSMGNNKDWVTWVRTVWWCYVGLDVNSAYSILQYM